MYSIKEHIRIAPWAYLQLLLVWSGCILWWLYVSSGLLMTLVLVMGMYISATALIRHAENMIALYYAQLWRFDAEGEESATRAALAVIYRHPKGSWICFRWAMYVAALDRKAGRRYVRNMHKIGAPLWRINPKPVGR